MYTCRLLATVTVIEIMPCLYYDLNINYYYQVNPQNLIMYSACTNCPSNDDYTQKKNFGVVAPKQRAHYK